MKDLRKPIKRFNVTAGESVRFIREIKGMSLNGLAEATGIPLSTISAIENGRVRLGVERAKVLAKAFKSYSVGK